ncbi:MAG: diguanylate cyclase, partial [Methylococcales bacterium]|nr:diguanylate cyclase [Methylococcales bacterium]
MHKISIQTLLIIVMSFVLIAIFAPMTFVVLKENNEINLLRQEQVGTALIPKIQRINILLAQHRGTANRLLNGNQDVRSVLTDLDNQITNTFADRIIQCQAQNIVLPCEQLNSLQAKWQILKNNYRLLATNESFAQHSLLIADMLAFLTNIADSSNLSLDSQLSSYYLMNNMVETLPHLIENIGQLRGFGSGLMVKSHLITTAEKIEITKLLYSVQLSMRAMNFQLNKVFIALPSFEQTQRDNFKENRYKIDQFLSTVERYAVRHESTLSDEAFYNQALDVITQIMTLYTPVANALNQELNQRIEVLLFKRYCIFTGAFFLISLLVCFLFHFKKRLDVLNHAIDCFEQLSIENYDHPITIKYHDEIGQLLAALTLMRNRLANNVEQFKHSISRLTEAQRIAHLGDWDWNVETDELHCSNEGYRVLDIIEDISMWNLNRFLNRIKTSDRDNVAATLAHAQQIAGNYDVEYRTNCDDGEQKIIHQRIESHANAQGKIVRLVGTLQDITLQREMEVKIRLAAEVFDNVGEAIVVTDKNNRVTLINNAFSKITGYSPKEVIGHNPNFLSSGKHDADFYKKMWIGINTIGMWKGEVWNQRKNGTLYPEILTITTIRNNAGEIINHIGIFSDITVQKRAIEQIEYLANYDALTGLMNRRALEIAAKQALISTKRYQQLLALLFIDLDGFKAVNDNLGHDVGDEVLKVAADRLKKTVRKCDLISRLGGDEFVVVLTNLSDVNSISS